MVSPLPKLNIDTVGEVNGDGSTLVDLVVRVDSGEMAAKIAFLGGLTAKRTVKSCNRGDKVCETGEQSLSWQRETAK